MKNYLLAGLLLASSAITPAAAATFGFSVTGTFDGTLYSYDADNNFLETAFTDQSFTLTGLFDGVPTSGSPIIPFSSFTISTGGQEIGSNDTSYMYFFPEDDEIYFAFGGIESTYLGFTVTFADLEASLDPVPATYFAYPLFDYQMTIGSSTYAFTAGRDLTLSAVVDGVPEPATWGMMALGFGLVGTGLRRRSRQAVAA